MKATRVIGLLAGICLMLLMATPLLAEETVCIQCHGGQEGRLGAPVSDWRGSVHAANRISCHDCHGGDPTDMAMAMSPERGFIGVPDYEQVPDFCGRCHVGVKEDYLASAHGRALAAGGPQCVICHESHRVQVASIELINETSCSRCHDYERAALVKQEISATEAALQDLETAVAGLHRLGIDVKQLEGDLFAQRNSFRRLFHSVEIEKIRQQTAEFDKNLATVRLQIEGIESELNQRKLYGGGVVLLLLAGGWIALLIRRSYQDS